MVNVQEDFDLLKASENGDVKKIKKIIESENEINFNIQDKDGNTPLILASCNGHDEIVEELVHTRANVNIQNKKGYTALIQASENGYLEVVKILINFDADTNVQSNTGSTPLIRTSKNGDREVAVELLKKTETNVNIKNGRGDTALSLASRNGHTDIVEELLNAWADANIQNKFQSTPLIKASGRGHIEVVKKLLNFEPDNKKDGDSNIIQFPRAKINLDAANKSGDTALIQASRNGHTEVVNLLLQAGAKSDNENNRAATPLGGTSGPGWTRVAAVGGMAIIVVALSMAIFFKKEAPNRKIACTEDAINCAKGGASGGEVGSP